MLPLVVFVLQFDKFPGKMDGLYRHPVSTCMRVCVRVFCVVLLIVWPIAKRLGESRV